MEKDWMMVYSTENEIVFSKIKNLLDADDIKYVCMQKKDSVYALGEIEIYVHYTEAEKALNSIYNTENE